MSQLDQKPTAEQEQFADVVVQEAIDGEGKIKVVKLIATRDVTRDLAVEAAAYEMTAARCDEIALSRHENDSNGIAAANICAMEISLLGTEAHTSALEAHDREREDRMLKRFEELAGRWQWASNLKTTLSESDAQKCGWSQCANELLSTIASIRKDRGE